MGLKENSAARALEALKLRLRERLETEHVEHPFPLSEAQQVDAERKARWHAVTSESWHQYSPSAATQRRRDAEISRDSAAISG